MSDEGSMSEGFSASEDEWQMPNKEKRGGESSDDDDSDYGEDDAEFQVKASAGGVVGAVGAVGAAAGGPNRKRLEAKARSSSAAPGGTAKQSGIAKKRKPMGQSLRSKLYNKYRPPPKTFPGAGASVGGTNSPSASTSRTVVAATKTKPTASKNSKAPNESSEPHDDDNSSNNSSSDSSVEDYLVKPAELDLASSFFDVSKRSSLAAANASATGGATTPLFDCNAGLQQLSESDSEDDGGDDGEKAHEKCTKAFDFRHLLEKANSLERAKATIAKRAVEAENSGAAAAHAAVVAAAAAMDVNSLLALGEKQCRDDDDENSAAAQLAPPPPPAPPHKLNKTKSTRVKRHTKTRPNSTLLSAAAVAGADTDDSDFEEVADDEEDDADESGDITPSSDTLEIHVELPSRHRPSRAEKKQQDVEMALRRRLNRDLKDRQLLLHKTSLLCCFGRSYFYNKLLNDTALMQAALKLLPSASAYPPERGTEIKYYQSLATWFKTAIKLGSDNLYPDKKTAALKKEHVRAELLQQLERREARCKQDMILLFTILVRGMGLQCRLVVNMQPLPLRPAKTDLLSLSQKRPGDDKSAESGIASKKAKTDGEESSEKSEETKTVPTLEKRNKELVKKSQEPQEKSKDSKEQSKSLKEHKKEAKHCANKPKEKSRDIEERLQGISEKIPDISEINKVTIKNSTEKSNNLKEPTEPIQKNPVTKIRKPTSLDVEFTPVARRTRHASTDNIPSLLVNVKTKKTVEVINKKMNELHETIKDLTKMKKNSEESKETNKDLIENIEITKEKNKDLTEQRNKGKDIFKTSIEKIQQGGSVNKSGKLTSISVEFTPVARRTRHASSEEQFAAKEKLNVGDVISVASKKSKSKPTTIKEKSGSTEDKNKVPQKGKENVVIAHIKDSSQAPSKAIEEKANLPISQKTKQRRFAGGRPVIEVGSPVIPKIVVIHQDSNSELSAQGNAIINSDAHTARNQRDARSRSKSPKAHISPTFLKSQAYQRKFAVPAAAKQTKAKSTLGALTRNANDKVKISTDFLKHNAASMRVTRSRKLLDDTPSTSKAALEQLAKFTSVPQLDGADDGAPPPPASRKKRAPQLKNLKTDSSRSGGGSKDHNDDYISIIDSDEDFVASPSKRPKQAPVLPKAVQALRKDRRVLSTDDENDGGTRRNATAADMWVEVWSDVEDLWVCIDLFKGKINSVESIRKSASSSYAYVFAFQNDLSIKDVTARYCPHWTTTMRKSRVDQSWLQGAISAYHGHRTKRDLCEDMELRRIHEAKPMPTAISDFKDNPLYALERHLLKFQAIYPPDAPTLGFVRGEAVYSRDCVHLLHSREIWLKQARTVKLGETPYKIVKARPKWDRLTQTIIKDQPLEIFGYWQTQDYEPPTAENGMVPRNAYGNVELFKACMLPKKTAHVKLPGLQRVCKKLGIDCANAVIGFDFHQGACHPTYDGFVVCEEFVDQVTAAWYQDQEEQKRKDEEKYEARVYGNWKKLIRGLLIKQRLKRKYNF